MCNLSIILSRVSDEYKIKKLKPLHGKGKKTNPKNYRLISILPVIFKILEIVIHNQTMDFINKKIFYTNFNQLFENLTRKILASHIYKIWYQRDLLQVY